jgi:accessory gene regulator protein AgrB
MDNSTLTGWIILIISCLALIFSNFYAKKVIECQNNIGFNFGEKEKRKSKIVIIILSSISIIVGILTILGIIKFK